jgi:uncharacterized protein GlcG (DUF336 family)
MTSRARCAVVTGVTLELAKRICEDGVARARELGLRVSVAVVDQGGNLVQVVRMDGCNFLAPDIARGKAVAAAAWQIPSGVLAERWAATPVTGSGMVAISGGRIVPVRGAIPLVREGVVVGAVGVSGARSEEDEQVAHAAISAAGVGTVAR